MTDLIKIEEINPAVVYASKDSIDGVLAQLQTAAEKHIPDLETDEGRKAIVSNAYKVRQSKSWLVKRGKELTADWRKKTKMVNELTNHVTAFCDELSDRLRAPVTEIEEREKAEREARRKELEMLDDWDHAIIENDRINKERAMAAQIAEFERKEAERKAQEKAEQEERDRKEREAQIAKEAAAAAERKAQQAIEDAKRATEQAEMDRLKAIEDAKAEKQAAIERERQKAQEEADRREKERLAAEAEVERKIAEEKAKAERLAAHKSHRKKIEKEAAMGFAENCAVDFVVGLVFVEAIEKGLIPHVTINY